MKSQQPPPTIEVERLKRHAPIRQRDAAPPTIEVERLQPSIVCTRGAATPGD
jgi:hypothetical protein